MSYSKNLNYFKLKFYLFTFLKNSSLSRCSASSNIADDNISTKVDDQTLHQPLSIMNLCPAFDKFRISMDKISDEIFKKISQEGEGDKIDLKTSVVRYEYAMYLEFLQEPFESSKLNKKHEVTKPDDYLLPPGYSIALSTMKESEEAMFLIPQQLIFTELGKFS